MSSVDTKCSICQKPLEKRKTPEVTLSCKHTFHRACATQRLNNGKSGDCPICRTKLALEHALSGDKSPTKEHGYPYDNSPIYNDNAGSHGSTPKSKSNSSDAYGKDSSDDEWECSNCTRKNSTSSGRCRICNQSRYSPSSAMNASASSAIKKSYGQKEESYDNSGSYNDHHSNPAKKTDNDGHSPSNRQRFNRQESNAEWICDECDYVNRGGDAVCKNCRQGKQSASVSVPAGRQSNKSPPPVRKSSAASYSSSKAAPKTHYQADDDADNYSSYSSSKATPKSHYQADDDADNYSSYSSSKAVRKTHYQADEDADNYSSYSSSKAVRKTHYQADDDDDNYSSHPSHKAVSKTHYQVDDNDDNYSSSHSNHDHKPTSKGSSKPKDYAHSSDVKPKPSKEKPRPSSPQDPVPVYISDLPLHIDNDQKLADHIRTRVEKSLRITPTDIMCYSKLGVGVMYVTDNQTKDHLINQIGVLALDPKDTKTMISFIETPDLVSYIVLEVPGEKFDAVFPSPEDISRKWADLSKGERPRACERLNSQFPNIYRLVSTSLDQLINSLGHQDFRVEKYFATSYFCADCSFFEDVPRSITKDQLQDAVLSAIKQPHISASSLYVQLNKQTGAACVIAANTARIWATITYLTLNGKTITKQDKLACRLLIHPVPKGLTIQSITQHSDFSGRATIFKQSGDTLILDISDKDVFDNCIKRGVLRLGDKYKLSMDAFSAANNPEGSDINADTWYDSEMTKSKPDIMLYIVQPDHFIFRCKWNAKVWLEQFQQATPEKFGGDFPKDPRDQRGTSIDLLRHHLQMTVMLNTLASVRNKRYFIKDREYNLHLNTHMKTIIYNHDSKLKKAGKMSTKIPYPKTTIRVVGDDCVLAYEKLVKQGRKPLLLNMASATSPGGGYRKGDGAQEENLFRRSDYFRSLDVGLDSFLPQRSERLRCTSDGRLEPLPEPHKMYPIEEYGAIYTSGLTFFRQSQDVGYEYLEKPLENVCAIAMAAYRDPKLEGKYLSSKYAVGTRKKIENTLSIAHHHGHDSIVLSALGCGAFRNPPHHVAKLFFSVIEQYAGFFDTIVFAIIDDHNAGQRLNPEGNFKPFFDVLDDKTVTPLTPMNKPDTMFGPYRISSDGSFFNDVKILDSHPCFYAAKCSDVNNSNHTHQYAHPPLCAQAAIKGKCDSSSDTVHMVSFVHRKQCQYGGECYNIDEKKHSQELEHPSYCSQGGSCRDMNEDHLRQFRHVPLCDKGTACMDYQKNVKKHCESTRHCQRRCRYGNSCANFHNRKHIKEEQHPFPPPCPHTPFHCSAYTTLSEAVDTRKVPEDIHQHCLDFSHVCRFGRNCANNTPLHQEKSIHIARRLCEFDSKCNRLNQDEHVNSFSHTSSADIRRVCKNAEKCAERRKMDHITKFRHARSHEDSGVVHYYGLNSEINFVQNQCEGMKRILDYVKNQKWKPLPSDTVPREILDWFRTVRPVHRCKPFIFESILLHGHVMSRDYMENLKRAKFVATSVMQHSRIRRMDNLKIQQYAQQAREYVIAVVTAEFDAANFPPPALEGDSEAKPAHHPPPASHASKIKAKERALVGVLSTSELDVLKTKAVEIAQASIKLHSDPAGIGYAPDKELGTHKRVFSILGPHLGHYYGDVFIVFKREILHHPDADVSMQAATTFGKSGNAYKWRPWLGDDPVELVKRIEQYHNTKLHASIPGFEYAVAMELMAITCFELKLKSMDIDLGTIFKRWLAIDSHRTIEAHLPQLIPVDYIDHIYMSESTFNSLSQQTRRSIDALFRHCIDVTPHKCPIDPPMGTFGPIPAEPERADYQNYVVDELLKRCKHDVEHPVARPIQGAVITIPASTFAESFVLPMTISQALDLHRMQHKKDPPEDIAYIYWQAINGDMMLVVSDEKLEPNDDKQPNLHCLLCYIAPKPESFDYNYHEQTTYLNCGSPFQHYAFTSNGKYKARSNTFHVGSNTDDFITYCLEIHRSTDKIILRQAGSNGIYNHEEISCEFKNKKELDVTKLEYVHVAANAKDVAVRNLIVCFEKQPELHPTFDSAFKKSTAPAPGPSASGGGHAHAHGDSSLRSCPDNVNCLTQYLSSTTGKEHNSRFSHPCRFSELCRNKEPYLTHDPHPSPKCPYDGKCRKLTDPFHRAENRHRDLSDFLVPCREQKKCTNNTDEHRTKYSHGEQVFHKKEASAAGSGSGDHRSPCKYGSGCKDMSDASHRARYSHPKKD